MRLKTPLPTPPGYVEHVFDGDCPVPAEAVVDLWLREGALDESEARRRVAEILLGITHESDPLAPVGVVTAFVRQHEQLRAPVWNLRAFVAPEHRMAGTALSGIVHVMELLEDRFLTGADRRGIGVLIEMENPGLAAHLTAAESPYVAGAVFIGSSRGVKTRLFWFEGAVLPE